MIKKTHLYYNLNESHVGLQIKFSYACEELEKLITVSGTLVEYKRIKNDYEGGKDIVEIIVKIKRGNKTYDETYSIQDEKSYVLTYPAYNTEWLHYNLQRITVLAVEMAQKNNTRYYVVILDPDDNKLGEKGTYEIVTELFILKTQKKYFVLCHTDHLLNKKKNLIDPDKEYILCPAVYVATGERGPLTPHNKQNGIVLAGFDACDLIDTIHGDSARIQIDFEVRSIETGFITSNKRFLDHMTAAKIAYVAGQVNWKNFNFHNELNFKGFKDGILHGYHLPIKTI